MTELATGVLLEVEGVLREILPAVFQTRLPLLLEENPGQRIRMMVTTRVEDRRGEAARNGNFYSPSREHRPPEFTWKAAGPLQNVIRQFRLDFLRHLGPEEQRCRVCIAVYQNAAAFETTAIAEKTAEPIAEPKAGSETFALSEDTWGGNGHGLELAPPKPPPIKEQAAETFAETATLMAQTLTTAETLLQESAADGTQPSHMGEIQHLLPGNFYQDFFGFERMPFNNTPDSFFYFPSNKHQEALSRLIYAISERKGFVMISGEIGSGKSTLCRTLLAQLPNEVKTALITHTHLDANQLVQAIAEDLGLEVRGKTRYEILQALNHFLIEQLAAGCTVCIIIDEAQNLSIAALEEVRMVSNLETEQEKLVQLILVGQPDLRDKIRLPELKQLRQRISVQYHLAPLERGEVIGYIRHRLRIAAPRQPLEFTRGAMAEVHRYSGGVPRLINSLCDNALLTAFTRQTRTINRRLIGEAAQDLDLEPRTTEGLAQYFKFW